MIAYICDRCGDVVASNECFKDPEISEYNAMRIDIGRNIRKKFCLCDKCTKELLLQVGVKLEEDNE